MNEFSLIKRLSRSIKTDRSVVIGIGDDTAVLQYKKDRYLLFTTDMIIEGTHFLIRSATPYQIGWKAMAVNLSDIAAMGGIPRWAVASLAGPFQRQRTAYSVQRSEKNGRQTTDEERRNIERFVWGIYRGMSTVGRKFEVQIVGGDTDKADRWTINIALLGEVEKKYLKLRSGAKVGDRVFVTGSLGGSIQGKHLTFIPRVKEARYLVTHYPVTSMMDLSDGLASDLRRIMERSKVGFLINEEKVPLSRDAKDVRSAFCDGEDFELLFTLPKSAAEKLEKNIHWAHLIGEVTPASRGLRMRDRTGQVRPIVWKGFDHF
jgi:thiamine-monophosphate kinase